MATKRGGKTGKEIGSLQTAFDILELVKSREPAGVSELARELDYSKSTVYYYLRTMANHRYLVNDGGEYRLGLRLLDYGGHVLASWNVPSIVEDELDQLAAETGETALFAVEEQGTSSYVYRSSGDANDPHLGAEHHLHATAFGKAILAHLPEARLTEVIERHGLPEVTENTITDVETLRGELEQIREHEVAFDDEEHRRAVRSIAAEEDATVGEEALN